MPFRIPRLKGAKITVESHVKVAGKGADAFWEIRPRGWLGGDLRCVTSPKVTVENEWFFQVKTLFLVGGVSYDIFDFFQPEIWGRFSLPILTFAYFLDGLVQPPTSYQLLFSDFDD